MLITNQILPDEVKIIRMTVAIIRLRKLYASSDWLTLKEYNEVRNTLAEVESNIGKLLHVKSVLEKIMLRAMKD